MRRGVGLSVSRSCAFTAVDPVVTGGLLANSAELRIKRARAGAYAVAASEVLAHTMLHHPQADPFHAMVVLSTPGRLGAISRSGHLSPGHRDPSVKPRGVGRVAARRTAHSRRPALPSRGRPRFAASALLSAPRTPLPAGRAAHGGTGHRSRSPDDLPPGEANRPSRLSCYGTTGST